MKELSTSQGDKMQASKNPESSIGTSYKSRTYKKITGCGSLYTTIAYRNDEDRGEKIEFIRITGEKESACGASYNESLSDLLTFSIRRIRNIHEARAIVKALRHHRCNKVFPNQDHTLSCADAIGQTLEEALQTKDKK